MTNATTAAQIAALRAEINSLKAAGVELAHAADQFLNNAPEGTTGAARLQSEIEAGFAAFGMRAPAAPAARPLTDEELDKLRQGCDGRLNFVTLRQFREVARAVERAHRIGQDGSASMRLLAEIATAAIRGPFSTTYRFDVREVEVAVLLRYPATRYQGLNRWHYMVDIVDHPDLCPEAVRVGSEDRYRVRVNRKLNPDWKPPVSGWTGNIWREGGAA